MINAAMADTPSDMTIAMHLCRGNFQSTFVASGGYEPVAEILFNTINVHGYFLEYDSDRAGGFEPLRFVPKGKTIVLGLVDEIRAARSRDELKRRLGDAPKYVPLEQHACRRGAVASGRRQYPLRGRAMGKACDDRRVGRRNLGLAEGPCHNVPNRHSALIMSAACCGQWRLRKHASSAPKARLRRLS
jgi:hypothetical protein